MGEQPPETPVDKLPWPPAPVALASYRPVYREVAAGTVLWRVHTTTGRYSLAWNQMRTFGPVESCRFDPHDPNAPGAPCEQDEKVLYAAVEDDVTAFAEVFQEYRRINRALDAPYLVAFAPTRDLRLLDLTGDWPLRIRASHAINGSDDKERTRAWARTLRQAYPEADGLLSLSSLTGGPVATMFAPAEDALPVTPDFSEPLTHPALADRLRVVAGRISYTVV